MLREASDEELFELVREDVVMAAARDLHDPPAWMDWGVVASRRSPGGDVLLVAGTDAGADHALVLFEAAADGAEAAINVARAAPRLGENDFRGHRRFRSGWIRPDQRGVLAVAFRAEPGATAVRYRRRGEAREAPLDPADHGRVVVVDWTDPSPIERFEGIVKDGEARPPVLWPFPYTAAFAADEFDAYWRTFQGPEGPRHRWIEEAFADLEGDDFEELTFALLKALDARRHSAGLAHLGAGPIYGSGHRFYDRLEREPDVPPENVFLALSMERPEFLPRDVAARHRRLMEDLARRCRNGPD